MGDGARFCCAGCEAAFETIRGMGLDAYYRRRCLDSEVQPMRPNEDGPPRDYASHVQTDEDGVQALHLMVEGLHCAACVWLIESVLSHEPGVLTARVNMTTRRLTLRWIGRAEPDMLVSSVARLGYRLLPFDPAILDDAAKRREKELLRAMAVAGFAAGNVMLLSVSIWAGHAQDMLASTRDLMHWISALIALPAIAYAGIPFYRSALGALAAGRMNMDTPISLAVALAAGMSLYETMQGGAHAYFDSAVSLLFFLLIGRYLDQRARSKAWSAAERLLRLNATAVTVIGDDGTSHVLAPDAVRPGMLALAAAGERIAVDGVVMSGESEVDASLVTGESRPVPVKPGDRVFAGTLNLNQPLTIEIGAVGEGTLLAEIVRLMESAEQSRSRYVAVADRVARWYAPVVHVLALAAFLGWFWGGDASWREALLNAISVLIITCPCALGLAVPAVNVIALARLMRRGILVKSGSALERLAEIETAAFDKTGALTLGRLRLTNADEIPDDALAEAAALAAASRHPLARSLVAAAPGVAVAGGVEEFPGKGLQARETRLGSREWCGVGDGAADGPELWLARPGREPVRFRFADQVRDDASEVVAALKGRGLGVRLLSGDRSDVVADVAKAVGIADWKAACVPGEKHAELQAIEKEGKRALMVGDGLNDAPALAAAHASMSPSTAMDVSQTAADVVFQGDRLGPVVETIDVARRAQGLIRMNFALAFAYNAVTVPLAMAGMVTPLVAAAAMSASSLMVIANALRLRGRG